MADESTKKARIAAGAKPTFKRVQHFRSSKGVKEWFAHVGTSEFTTGPPSPSEDPSVFIYPRSPQGVHPFMGFGGSFTEASAHVFSKMSAGQQDEVLEAYFGPSKGLRFNLGRIHIASCDFGLGNWTCGDLLDGDMSLSGFSLDKYEELILPMYRRALEARQAPFTLLASPWSPPPWMKTKQQFHGDGHLKQECSAAWALHFAKFVKGMAEKGVDIWGVSVQNEPEAAQIWESCIYTAAEETVFVRDHLGPTMEKEGLGNTKILVCDHNRVGMLERAAAYYDDDEAAKYIWGLAYHWYGDARFESWPDRVEVPFQDRQRDCKDIVELRSRFGFENVRKVHELCPEKHILFTEGCQELGGRKLADILGEGNWKFGERYGMNIINDLNSGTEGWIDWNLLLDENGGPNHVGNTCLAPVVFDTQTSQIQYQSPFAFMGHFSKFVSPGAMRVLVSASRDALEVVGFLNPDQTLVVVVMNQSESDLEFDLKLPGQSIQTSAIRRSINTYVLDSGEA